MSDEHTPTIAIVRDRLAPGENADIDFAFSGIAEEFPAEFKGLDACFSMPSRPQRIGVWLGKERLGVMSSESWYDDVKSSLRTAIRSVGRSAYFQIPGDPDTDMIVLACPEDGCSYRVAVAKYVSDRAPSCRDHPQKRMEPAV